MSEDGLKKEVKKVKVNVVYGDRKLFDCMKRVIEKHTKL